MKRFSAILLLLLPLVFAACDKEEGYKIREWTIASRLGIAHAGATLQPVLLCKTDDDASWRALYGGIEGFEFEPGYEYRLRVKTEQVANPPADGSSVRYTLLAEVSKTSADSGIPAYPEFTMQVAPDPVSHSGELYLAARFPEAGLYEWQPWPYPIEGFEFEQGYLCTLRVATSVIPAANGFMVRYSVAEIVDKQPVD